MYQVRPRPMVKSTVHIFALIFYTYVGKVAADYQIQITFHAKHLLPDLSPDFHPDHMPISLGDGFAELSFKIDGEIVEENGQVHDIDSSSTWSNGSRVEMIDIIGEPDVNNDMSLTAYDPDSFNSCTIDLKVDGGESQYCEITTDHSEYQINVIFRKKNIFEQTKGGKDDPKYAGNNRNGHVAKGNVGNVARIRKQFQTNGGKDYPKYAGNNRNGHVAKGNVGNVAKLIKLFDGTKGGKECLGRRRLGGEESCKEIPSRGSAQGKTTIIIIIGSALMIVVIAVFLVLRYKKNQAADAKAIEAESGAWPGRSTKELEMEEMMLAKIKRLNA